MNTAPSTASRPAHRSPVAFRPHGRLDRAPTQPPRGALGRDKPQSARPSRRKDASRPTQTKLVFDPDVASHEAPRVQLQRRLGLLLSRPVSLQITDNQRTMISARQENGELRLRLHHMFLHADGTVLKALARYLERRDRRASARLGQFIDAERHRIRRRPRKPPSLRTGGRHHDLSAIFDRINAHYFGGACSARITWGRRAATGRRRRRSIKLGSYCAEDALVRIHPALDRPWVPAYFVEYVVYHEMLHHMIPARVHGGRRELHGPEFRAHEQRFAHYARALAWERRHVHRLLAR